MKVKAVEQLLEKIYPRNRFVEIKEYFVRKIHGIRDASYEKFVGSYMQR